MSILDFSSRPLNPCSGLFLLTLALVQKTVWHLELKGSLVRRFSNCLAANIFLNKILYRTLIKGDRVGVLGDGEVGQNLNIHPLDY